MSVLNWSKMKEVHLKLEVGFGNNAFEGQGAPSFLVPEELVVDGGYSDGFANAVGNSLPWPNSNSSDVPWDNRTPCHL